MEALQTSGKVQKSIYNVFKQLETMNDYRHELENEIRVLTETYNGYVKDEANSKTPSFSHIKSINI